MSREHRAFVDEPSADHRAVVALMEPPENVF
jgi:hypothetical protein